MFISYRQSDGTKIAAKLAWLLRTAGIPVWRDRDDLPPGDTDERLKQALSDGISGGVLVITPEIEISRVVKKVEAPRLIAFHQENQGFALGIANATKDAAGKIDYTAPDRLLEEQTGTLSGVDQKSSSRKGLVDLVRQMVWHRISQLRKQVETNDETFNVSIQTRNTPQVYDRTDAELDIRLRPSRHERLPSIRGLRDLKDTIGLLPNAVTRSGARRVRVHGGAHLSVAFALGAALPSTRVGEMEVIDSEGACWRSDSEPQIQSPPAIRVKSQGGTGIRPPEGRPAVAVYVDLYPLSSDSAFEQYLEDNAAQLSAWEHLTYEKGTLINSCEGGQVAAEVAARIRMLSYANRNAEVHLLLRCPFPLAVLIARLTNTLRFVVYEWNDTELSGTNLVPVRYTPTVRIRTTAHNGVIDEILLH